VETTTKVKESNLDRVERGLKELGVTVVGPSIYSCDCIDGEYARVNFYVAPGGPPLRKLDELQLFANRIREKIGPASGVQIAKVGCCSIDLPNFLYEDVVATRSEKFQLQFTDPRAKEALHFPVENAAAKDGIGMERVVDIKRGTTVVVCPSKGVAEFALENLRDGLMRYELAELMPEFRCGDSIFEGLMCRLMR
jgi:hypothetical protein